MTRHVPKFPVDEVESRHHGRSEVVISISAGGVSGAIIGFFLACELRLAVGVFAALTLGLLAGWWARGVSIKGTREGVE